MEHKNKFVKSLCIAAFLSILCLPQINSKAMAQAPVPTLDRLNQEGATIPDTDPPQVYPESAYTLTEIENADPENLPQNAITLYDKNEDGTVTPKYYTISLKQTEFGDKENYGEKLYFKWEKTDNKYSLVKANESDADITYYVNNTRDDSPNRIDTDQNGADITDNFKNLGGSTYGGAIYNVSGEIGNITGDFISNNATFGGAIYNENGTIGNITGDFVGNYTTTFYSGGSIYNDNGRIGDITGDFIANSADEYGGAIYNSGSNAKIGNIKGDFIANSSLDAGGAIYNEDGTIGNITGDFIGNCASVGFSPFGGAISNERGTIGDITGDFIGNYVFSGSAYTQGGAISNERGTIGDITGDFIGNYAYSTDNSAYGGAIYNNYNGTIGNITGDFIGNYAFNSDYYYGSRDIRGGAIYNEDGTIGNITGDFIGNYAYSTDNSAYGGAIYNEDGTIGNITGDFISNYVFSKHSYALGGAIYNNRGTIGNITGDFIANYVSSNGFDDGGAIYNEDGSIGNIAGVFIGNYASRGGAICNIVSNAEIGNITGDFIGNYASGRSYTYGGAIYNDDGTIGNITGDFISNYVSSTNDYAYGGAISNNRGTIGAKDDDGNVVGGIINSNFINNYAKSETGEARGGAIYTDNSLSIIAKDGGQSVFSGNYTESNGVKTPNAIYVETTSYSGPTNLEIVSINGDKATYKEITELESPSYVPTLTLNANTNGVIVFDDTIDGNVVVAGTNTVTKTGDLIIDSYYQNQFNVSNVSDFVEYVKANPDKFWWYENNMTNEEIVSYLANNRYLEIENEQTVSTESKLDKYSYTLALDGDSSGAIYLNNEIINANISVDNTNVYVSEGTNLAQSRSLAVNSGVLNIQHLNNQTVNFEQFSNKSQINLASVDVDLANESMGRITADEYGETTGKINVQGLNLLSDATKDTTSILFADEQIADSVSYTGVSPIAYSPIWKYDVSYTQNPEDNLGYFTFVRGAASSGNASDAFNPSVLASPVATQAGAYTTQLQTFNYAFQHADTFMNIPYLERVAIINQGKYAMSPTGDATDVGTYSPLLLKEESAGFWVKPYASFENVPLKNGPKVSNINYGTLVGYDSPLTSVGNGFERVLTGYIGYNGASQRYSGVDAYQNGGLLGGTATFYKGNFFNATTLSVGASAGDASTMYGSENYTMLLAGVGNKTGYNFEFFNGGMILQPSMLISYTFVNTFDYTNGAGVRIESDPMHAIQLAPGIKLIGNTKNGWQPYIGVNMVWNLLDDSRVTANDVRLPEMSIKPYVQYGVGIQKRFKDRFLAFGQAMIHNGGRNGVSLSAGLRWKIGRE